jgi:prophage antirepressor-like protein
VASDVCKVLEITNVGQAINGNDGTGNTGLDDDEKDYIMIHNVVGIQQATLCINEPGLYHLISKSRTPEAKAFGRWIRHEVLPALRKTGHYSLPHQEPQQQSWQEAGLQAYLQSLSKDALSSELHYLRSMLAAVEVAYNYKYSHLPLSKNALSDELYYLCTMLEAVETYYNYKYPQARNSEYPQEEHGPHPVETPVLPAVETQPDLQAILVDYLHKAETVTVRYLQQSGPRCLRNLPADQLRAMLQTLVANRVVKIVPLGKAEGYQLI